MKLDLKEWIRKIINSFGEYDTVQTVSFPFTAQKDGIVIVPCSAPTSSFSGLYVSEDGNGHARGFSVNGAAYSLTFPVVKGKVYAVSYSSNVSYSVKYYPFMGGGTP